MGLEQHLTEKISNVLLSLDLSYEVTDSFKEYVEGNVGEEEFFNICLLLTFLKYYFG